MATPIGSDVFCAGRSVLVGARPPSVSPRFHWLPSLGSDPIVLDRVLPGFNGFYRVLPGFNGFYRVLQGFPRLHFGSRVFFSAFSMFSVS